MGEMIGNIAHQWRQPLNAIVLIIQSFQMKRIAGLELSDAFIDKQTNEGIQLASLMSQTIDDFRNYFKPNRSEELFGVKDTLLYSLNLVQEFYAKSGIEIFLNSTHDVQISGYPNEFSQVIMNLFSNAKDVLEERAMEEKLIEVIITKEVNNAVISVVDNGGGISDEVQDRMFEPYFTTKHKSSGTGIGLYMSKQIIEKQMQGSISGTNISYVFQNGKRYERCAMMTILVPLEKKEEI
jgi:two-component system, NtrC family, C4-dicarboxylate transport sensor histidine kinase DctB